MIGMVYGLLGAMTAFAGEISRTEGCRIMGFNIWGPFFGNPVAERTGKIAGVIVRYNPDVLAIQEMHPDFWASQLPKDLLVAGYVAFAPEAPVGGNNWIPLFYKTNRLERVDGGFEQYCPHLDASKSVTWCVFRNRRNSRYFISFATHFWWRTDTKSDDQVREDNARQLIACLRRVQKAYPDAAIIGGGDVNTLLKSWAMEALEQDGLLSAQKIDPTAANISTHHRDPVRGTDGKYHGFLRKGGDNTMETSIDHIFVEISRIKPVKTLIVTDQDALDVSDHCPVVVDFEFAEYSDKGTRRKASDESADAFGRVRDDK